METWHLLLRAAGVSVTTHMLSQIVSFLVAQGYLQSVQNLLISGFNCRMCTGMYVLLYPTPFIGEGLIEVWVIQTIPFGNDRQRGWSILNPTVSLEESWIWTQNSWDAVQSFYQRMVLFVSCSHLFSKMFPFKCPDRAQMTCKGQAIIRKPWGAQLYFVSKPWPVQDTFWIRLTISSDF